MADGGGGEGMAAAVPRPSVVRKVGQEVTRALEFWFFPLNPQLLNTGSGLDVRGVRFGGDGPIPFCQRSRRVCGVW